MTEIIFLFSTTLMYATPLIFTALGGVMSEKSGIINIGLEGMMTFGAFSASLVAIKTGNPWLGLLAGGLGGMFLAIFHGLASIKYKANQVVSGMAINFLGAGLAVFLCRVFFEGTSMTPPLDLEKKIPLIFNQYGTVYIAFLFTLIIWFIFNKTTLGLRLISAGEHPKATSAAGINACFYRYIGVYSSGFLAGLGGASLSIAIVSNFRPTLISGQGFIALAAMIFGKWNPVGTMLACLFFGFSQALVVYIGGIESLHISSQLLATLPYILTLIILIGFMKKTTAPSALGSH
ncbi:MAG: ABC transporter permease [Bdellovibrionales bacterium]|nr:ABC transporter permease [Bdellovibrionales bacterium]